MQRQNYNPEEEYQQFLAHQQSMLFAFFAPFDNRAGLNSKASLAQHSAHGNTTQQQQGGQYPGQYQNYPPHPSAVSGHSYPEGYYQPGTGGLPPSQGGGYAYSQTQQAGQLGQASAGMDHSYRALPSTPQSTIDTYIAIIQLPESEGDASGSSARSRRAYMCKWKGCPKAVNNEYFKSKDNARVHVHKHFGSDKLFECIVPTCRKQFASEDAAKRHRDTTDWKAYTCGVCQNAFARKDYRDWHQARCGRQ
ncbi:hypothetical protein Clacol_003505 [Clathrus columnatus]|uniref:C2H2-type domain-containing protein n=1 Tax=Clathrus columnatus TaxID=1419009 RepID=A0AAV5A9E8_9AGAM|nr:hypothetical protein Clacol_003505 [Clathrus columnatus]